jgi:two-component system NtrC family sensor kinase
MIIILIGVTFAPMVLITGIILYRFNSFSHEMVHAHLKGLVLEHKHQIDFFLNEKLSNIRYLSRSFEPELFRDNNFLKERLQDLREEYGLDFEDLELIDDQGHQVAYAGPSGKDAYHGKTRWFNEAMETRHYISDVFSGPKARRQFIVATKVQKENTQWILKAAIDFGSVNSLVENLKAGETGIAFIVNRQGEFQTQPPDKIRLIGQQYLSLFDQAKNAKEVNEKLVIVSASLKNTDWILILQQDIDEAFSDLKFSKKFAALIFSLGSIGIVLVCVLLFRRASNTISEATSEKELVMTQQFIETGKLDSIGELASGIAHEINNPVAIMVEEAGWVQDLIHEGIDKNDNLEEFIRALKQIETQGHRCKEITRKLLSFGRKTDSRVESVQLNDLIEEMVSFSSEKARHANVKIHTHLDPHLPEIQASVTEIQQVLSNIINNGLDAMENKGDRLDISSKSNEDHIAITVRDNGPGIPAINLNRVFDPFFSTKPVGKGSGLGLSICYGIIKKMGGRIDFESVVGEGSAFHVVLPLNNTLE